jgi:hypothetical protein
MYVVRWVSSSSVVDRKVGGLVARLVGYLVVEKEIMEGETKWVCVNNSFLIRLFILFIVYLTVLFMNLIHINWIRRVATEQ